MSGNWQYDPDDIHVQDDGAVIIYDKGALI